MGKKSNNIKQIADTIDANRSLRDYIGNKRDDELNEYERSIKVQFNLKIGEIQKFHCDFCEEDKDGYRLDPGITLVLINRQSHWSWNTIPFGKMEIIKEWVIKNHHHHMQIMDKDYHYGIMEMENNPDAIEYQQWFNKHEAV